MHWNRLVVPLASAALVACGSSNTLSSGSSSSNTGTGATGATSGSGGHGSSSGTSATAASSTGSTAASTSTSTSGSSGSTTGTTGTIATDCLASSPGWGGAQSAGGGTLCATPGWCDLPGTHMRDVCPDASLCGGIQAYEGCSGVLNDWGGAALDSSQNMLILWGGGHHGYFGNEVYALDLNRLVMLRLNDPSDVSGFDPNNCDAPDAYPDGRPVSRHTYDGLTYIPSSYELFSWSGAKAPCGYSGTDIWTLDLPTVGSTALGGAAPWTERDSTVTSGQLRADPGSVSDYDAHDDQVVFDDLYSLWSFSDATGVTLLLDHSNNALDDHMTGRIDPVNHLFIVMGNASAAPAGGVFAFDLTTNPPTRSDWTSQVTGCDGLIQASYPGLSYDTQLNKFVGWVGGNTVYIFDPSTKSCTTQDYTGGPAANANGTFGRFRYVPSLDVFAVVNGVDQDAYTLRLGP
ncbi:MAG: hypothetical protein JST54_35625 [Deltaproteobacteria bacterium]|nr:hypothetical protein [Deltaproteobacteria bacterium]